jgi:CheY-like chemotaxis protein
MAMESAGMPSSSLPVDVSDFLHNPSRVLQLLAAALLAAERSNREKGRFLGVASRHMRQTRMLLRTDGYKVAVASSLSEALVQSAHQPSIQLQIADGQLGNNETGLLVNTLVRQRVARELKAIQTTGDTSTARHALRRDDRRRVANKPVDADTFLLLVSELTGL